MADPQIDQLEEDGRGAFVVHNPDDGPPRYLAEMTYEWHGEVMVIVHTGVREALQGQGVARKLVGAAIDKARADGFRISPVCPYAKKVFDRDLAGLMDVRAVG